MIVEGRISSLQDEIDIATDVERIASIHIADRRDEIQFLQYAIRIVQWVLVGADDNREQRQWIGVDKMLLEPEDIMRFENMLHEKIQELQVELVESYSIRESDITMHEIETLEFVLDQLSKLKSEDCMQNKKEITEPTSIYGIQNIMK
jgi:hypothetical protein